MWTKSCGLSQWLTCLWLHAVGRMRNCWQRACAERPFGSGASKKAAKLHKQTQRSAGKAAASLPKSLCDFPVHPVTWLPPDISTSGLLCRQGSSYSRHCSPARAPAGRLCTGPASHRPEEGRPGQQGSRNPSSAGPHAAPAGARSALKTGGFGVPGAQVPDHRSAAAPAW